MQNMDFLRQVLSGRGHLKAPSRANLMYLSNTPIVPSATPESGGEPWRGTAGPTVRPVLPVLASW